jgi:hypothetical protein
VGDDKCATKPAATTEAPSKQAPGAAPDATLIDDGSNAGEGSFIDLNKARVEVVVDRFNDVGVARDIIVNVRAENAGRRALLTAIRGRMLSFTVEQLGSDNHPKSTADCVQSDRPHGAPAESLFDLNGGQSVTVPILLAEICPAGTFDRPGLYRVLPRIDTTVAGEGAKANAFVGRALARQSTLIRVATGRQPFEDDTPHVYQPPATPPANQGYWIEERGGPESAPQPQPIVQPAPPR